MPQEEGRCKYKYRRFIECPHSVHSDGLCIFHLPKLNNEEKNKLIPGSEEARRNEELEEKFRTDFYALLKRWDTDDKVNEFDFVEFQFPEIDLSNSKLKEVLLHEGFIKPLNCQEAQFNQPADFRETQFHQQQTSI